MLRWAPCLRLEGGAYEAQISPGAGARLSRLAWRSQRGPVDLLVPCETSQPAFDADQWPKCGAFPMVPYTNRLRDGVVRWTGRAWQVRVPRGQHHGVHGFGHRVAWEVEQHTASRAVLVLQHAGSSPEWPWPFTARTDYQLSEQGLAVTIRVTNTADEPAPVAIGWHPYLSGIWRSTPEREARRVHDLGEDGLAYPCTADARLASGPVRDSIAHTFALEGARSPWTLTGAHGAVLTLGFDSGHVVHHRPAGGGYECVEPVTALPGALARGDIGTESIALAAGETRVLRCSVGVSMQR